MMRRDRFFTSMRLTLFAFLKEQIGTSYYEDLIQEYLLDNTHASIVMICPKKGMAAEARPEDSEKASGL